MKKFVVTLAIILLLAASARAQAPFYQGKTITIIVGTKAGDAYDLYPRMLAEFMPKYIPGESEYHYSKCSRRGLDDCRQSSLQCRQAGRIDYRRHLSGALF